MIQPQMSTDETQIFDRNEELLSATNRMVF